ncbi:hypothetical protein GCM10007079_47710 [Nocardiopsis terrae]|nr:hypothetical protein GCM10007079_47710 [Nocardiopsis terrae]
MSRVRSVRRVPGGGARNRGFMRLPREGTVTVRLPFASGAGPGGEGKHYALGRAVAAAIRSGT